MIVYGIKNCDTVKKALAWLKTNNVAFDFHDYKKKGIDPAKLKAWSDQVGWESLINKRGTTWRQLDEPLKNAVLDENSAFRLMQDKPSVIKRPLIEKAGKVILIGYEESQFAAKLT